MVSRTQEGFHVTIILLGLIFLGVAGFAGYKVISNQPNNQKINTVTDTSAQSDTTQKDVSQAKIGAEAGWPSKTAKYIVAVPVDLTQIQNISKYRSCSGHDLSGYSFERILETDRSMKHYLYPVPAYQATIDKIKMFAPFDGTVSNITLESEEIGQPGKRPQTGNSITFSTPVDKYAAFQFAHIYFVKDFKVGDKVKSGELIGYAAVSQKINGFDIVLTGTVWTEDKQPIIGSIFDHMSDKVLAEFASYGVTPANTKFSKEYRDVRPCNFGTAAAAQGWIDENWVILKIQ
ncbi:MAG: hypothetical protein Q7R60_03345, partial [bacterium]|nr:hypothetical protein [bacterium]